MHLCALLQRLAEHSRLSHLRSNAVFADLITSALLVDMCTPFLADFNAVVLEFEGSRYALARDTDGELAHGVLDIAHLGVLKLQQNGQKWACTMCNDSKNCGHVRTTGHGLAVTGCNADRHAQRRKRWLDPSTGDRRLTCQSRLAVPRDLSDSAAFLGVPRSSCALDGQSMKVQCMCLLRGRQWPCWNRPRCLGLATVGLLPRKTVESSVQA